MMIIMKRNELEDITKRTSFREINSLELNQDNVSLRL